MVMLVLAAMLSWFLHKRPGGATTDEFQKLLCSSEVLGGLKPRQYNGILVPAARRALRNT